MKTIKTALLKAWYKAQWTFRGVMLPLWGQDCSQLSNKKGVETPDGLYYSYGKQYHRMYFLGKIR